MSFASRMSRLAASASVSSVVIPAKQFLEQADEAGPRPLRRERVVSNAVDLELAGVGVCEAVADIAIGVDLPVAAGFGQFLPERNDSFRRHHRVVPAVIGDDLRLDLLLGKPRRVEEAVEADGGGHVRPRPGEIERALAAKAIAGNDDLSGVDLVETSHLIEHREKTPPKRRAVRP